jgi:hypothetical protein
MMRWLAVVGMAQLVATGAMAAESLCADTRAADTLPMRESDFELYRSERNLDLLSSLIDPFKQAIAKADDHQPADPASLPSAATFASSYPNALHQILGTLLKQRAQIAEQQVAIAKLHRRYKEVRTAQADFDAARQEFCHYLETTSFVR